VSARHSKRCDLYKRAVGDEPPACTCAGAVAYVGGTFDLFHPGHLGFFRQVRQHADRIVVGLNTDEFCERYKRRPVLTYAERFGLLHDCRLVNAVIPNVGAEDSRLAIAVADDNMGVDFVAHGDDWTGDSLMKQMCLTQQWLDERRIRMLYVPYTPGVSTSDIIRRTLEREYEWRAATGGGL
jgi:glycerol-3-phosphate cytidylyltransferase